MMIQSGPLRAVDRALLSVLLFALLLVLLFLRVTLANPEPPQTNQPKRVGIVWIGSANEFAPDIDELRRGLRERGWVEGATLVIESRYAEGRIERLPEIAAELVRLPVDVLVTAGVPPTLALKRATQTIPIVVAAATDPAGTGLVTPGGTVAAFDILPSDAARRQVSLLTEVVPGLRSVAIVWNGSNPAGQLNARRATESAHSAGLGVISVEVQDAGELQGALAGLRGKGAQALFLVSDPSFSRKQVGALITEPFELHLRSAPSKSAPRCCTYRTRKHTGLSLGRGKGLSSAYLLT